MADITQTSTVAESTLIPYIRRQDVYFDVDNLRPQKIGRLFLDEVVMNNFAQVGNKIVLNSKKILTITANTGAPQINVGDTVYQGSSISPTFTAIVDSYASGNLTIRTMSGAFDVSANVLVENVTSVTTTTANVSRVVNSNTSDVFSINEGVYCSNTQTYMRVIGSSGENLLYVCENFINLDIVKSGATTLKANSFKQGDLVFQTLSGVNNINVATFTGKVEYYYNANTANAFLAITPLTGNLAWNLTATNAATWLWNSSNTTTANAASIQAPKLVNLAANNILVSTANVNKQVSVVSHEHSSGFVANTANVTGHDVGGQYVYLNSSDVSIAVGNIMYITAGTGLGAFRRVVGVSGKRVELLTALDVDPTTNTKYSIGNFVVDENGGLDGILNIPEEPNFKFKTGDRVFTITDTDTINDSDYTMKTSARFSAGGLRNVLQRTDLSQSAITMSPFVPPLPPTPPNNPVMPPPPTSQPASPTPVSNPVSQNSQPTAVASRSIARLFPRFRSGDPIAQTFFTPKPASNKVNYGMFVTSVDLFFGVKPSVAQGSLQLPISVKIAEVVNGYPTSRYLAVASVKAKDVKVSTSPSITNADSITKFTFPDPVFLQPDTEYALVIYSDSPEYEVYVAALGGNVLGADPPQRISEQPYAGSFFRSQNSTTWTAYQNEDLMFVINKAVFSSTGSAVFNLKNAPTTNHDVARLLVNADKIAFPSGIVDFKVQSVFKSNSNPDVYNLVKPQEIFKYGDLMDASNKADSASFLNTRQILLGNCNSLNVLAEFVSSDPDISPVFNMETLGVIAGSHDINNAGISNNIISIVNRGVGYNAISASGNTVKGSQSDTLNNAAQLFRETYLANNFNIGFYKFNHSSNTGTGADGFAVANTDGNSTVDYIIITNEGSGYVDTPTCWLTGGNATVSITAALATNGETSKRGGNIRAKYITRQVTLEDGFESGDLRVYMDVVRPNGTDVEVYYKVLGNEDPDRLSDKSWVRMYKKVDRKSKDARTIVELEYHPDLQVNKLSYVENGVQYPIGDKFKQFSIKVCLTAVDSTVVPYVQNLRIIATPAG